MRKRKEVELQMPKQERKTEMDEQDRARQGQSEIPNMMDKQEQVEQTDTGKNIIVRTVSPARTKQLLLNRDSF